MEANIQEEIWKDIPEFTGYYQASNLGRIRRLETLVKNRHGGFSRKKGRILKCGFNSKNGYLCASICVMGHTMPRTVHSMVAKTFIDNPNNKPQVNHIDSNRINNNILNLEWVTISENRIHCIKAGNGPKRGHTAIINKNIAVQE